jgi:hypothetical protein
MGDQKTTIKDVPLANDRLCGEVARLNKIPKAQVEDFIDFVGTYTAGVIREGTMEAVHIPYFGKFKPKVAKVKAAAKIKINKRNGKDIIYRALKGMAFRDYRLTKGQGE